MLRYLKDCRDKAAEGAASASSHELRQAVAHQQHVLQQAEAHQAIVAAEQHAAQSSSSRGEPGTREYSKKRARPGE